MSAIVNHECQPIFDCECEECMFLTEDVSPRYPGLRYLGGKWDEFEYGYARSAGYSFDDFIPNTFPIERASEAKSDEYVVPWQTGTLCTITKCKALAIRTQVHEDYTAIWQAWLKKQKDEKVCVENVVRHPFQSTANLPTVEFLKNPDNFKLLREFLFHDGSGRFSGAALDKMQYPGGPLKGIPFFEEGEKSERIVEDSIMKYIYGRYHFETIRFCFDLEDYPGLEIRRELDLLKVYYTWYGDEFGHHAEIRIPRVIKLYKERKESYDEEDEEDDKHFDNQKKLAPLRFTIKKHN